MWTASDLLAMVRRTAFMPNSAGSIGGFTDTDILTHADEVMAQEVVPTIISMREEWFVRPMDIPITPNVSDYRIPSRNIAGRIRDVQLIRGNIPYNLARYEPETYLNFSNGFNNGIPTGFLLQNNAIVLVPTPSTGDILRIKYFFRPNNLNVPGTATDSQFLSITPASSTISSITTATPHGLSIGSVIDMVRNTPNFETVFYSVVVLSVPSTTNFYVLTSQLPSDLVNGTSYDPYVGSWISLQYTTPVLQCPVELQGYWQELTAAKVMEAHGDVANAQLARARADNYRKGAVTMLAPRVEGEPRKLLGGMLFKRGLNNWWR